MPMEGGFFPRGFARADPMIGQLQVLSRCFCVVSARFRGLSVGWDSFFCLHLFMLCFPHSLVMKVECVCLVCTCDQHIIVESISSKPTLVLDALSAIRLSPIRPSVRPPALPCVEAQQRYFSYHEILVAIVSQYLFALAWKGYHIIIARYVAKCGIAQMCLCEPKCQEGYRTILGECQPPVKNIAKYGVSQ